MAASAALPNSILITGASSGLGAALALAYAGAGQRLVLVGRDDVRLQQVATQCRAKGANVETQLADVRDADAMRRIVEAADAAMPLELVIANAGISAGTFSGEKDLTAAQAVFDVNVDGVLHTVHPVLPHMIARKRGQIAIISSLASIIPLPGAAAYSASKAAVRYYGEALRGHLKRHDVSVSVVCPGWIRTPLVSVNRFPMPFMLSAEDAAERIKRGLLRRSTRISFPWPLYFALRLFEALPASWVNALGRALPGK